MTQQPSRHSDHQPSTKRKRSPWRTIAKLVCALLFLVLLLPMTAFAINAGMCLYTLNDLKPVDTFDNKHVDYIMVLGAGIEADGSPSPILEERLDTAAALYKKGAAKEIIVSGGTDESQSEVSSMFNYLVKKGVPQKYILCDTKGVDTFASVHNLSKTYEASSAVIVSQRFHLYRALFIAKQLHLDAYGCPSSTEDITDRDLIYREFLARVKDFAQVTLGTLPEPLTKLAEWSYQQLTPYIRY